MPNLEHEFRNGHPVRLIAGTDEVGRGCIAGPVVAGAVLLPSQVDFEAHPWLNEINDSKKLSPATRERLVPLISHWALGIGIGVASVEEIDQLNIFHASHLAMLRAIEALPKQPDHILVDGKFLPQTSWSKNATAIIQGDQKSLSIAAASILAKVWRDQHMVALHQHYPHYGFSQHKGYPTAAHVQALQRQGLTEHHRRSFKTIAALNENY